MRRRPGRGAVRHLRAVGRARRFGSQVTGAGRLATLCVLGGGAACGPAAELRHSDPGYFVQTSRVYAIGEVTASVDEWGDELFLFGIMDMEETDAGYLLADASNHRLVLLDRRLNLLGTKGQEGDGPGEYQFVESMARADDHIVVLDQGINRVSYVGMDGTFLSSVNVRPNPSDVAYHPDLGLLVADDRSPHHYLSRYRPRGGQVSLAEIPTQFRDSDAGAFRIRTDMVAVAADGSIHVLDGLHLALASYASDGAYLQTAYLPEPERTKRIERRDRRVKARGGPSVVLGSHIATSLQPLADGRLFVRTSSVALDDRPGLIVVGYVLDPFSLEATPFTVATKDERALWVRSKRVHFGVETALLGAGNSRGPQLAVTEVKLVEH